MEPFGLAVLGFFGVFAFLSTGASSCWSGFYRRNHAPQRKRGLGQRPIPVIVLTRLGVDVRDQRRGLGAEIVYDAFLQAASVAGRVGARALLIHAETKDTADFYRRLDPAFETLPSERLHLVLLMKDLRKAIAIALAAARRT